MTTKPQAMKRGLPWLLFGITVGLLIVSIDSTRRWRSAYLEVGHRINMVVTNVTARRGTNVIPFRSLTNGPTNIWQATNALSWDGHVLQIRIPPPYRAPFER